VRSSEPSRRIGQDHHAHVPGIGLDDDSRDLGSNRLHGFGKGRDIIKGEKEYVPPGPPELGHPGIAKVASPERPTRGGCLHGHDNTFAELDDFLSAVYSLRAGLRLMVASVPELTILTISMEDHLDNDLRHLHFELELARSSFLSKSSLEDLTHTRVEWPRIAGPMNRRSLLPFPSASREQPWRAMKGGSIPTAFPALTGLFTLPGISFLAFSNKCLDFFPIRAPNTVLTSYQLSAFKHHHERTKKTNPFFFSCFLPFVFS
jgi:hypothetical protein